MTESASMFTVLKHGFANFQIISGFSFCVPVALVQRSTVKQSFDFLRADFSWHDTKVLLCEHFHGSGRLQFADRRILICFQASCDGTFPCFFQL